MFGITTNSKLEITRGVFSFLAYFSTSSLGVSEQTRASIFPMFSDLHVRGIRPQLPRSPLLADSQLLVRQNTSCIISG